MSFDTSAYLRRATGRAKSDVANKLVSMFLHDVSRKLCSTLELSVSDPRYVDAVAKTFGPNCCYCGRILENDRAAVEHLEGTNRFRVGLHIPGNVILSCKRCNKEKRRDDGLAKLTLAKTGWESFLAHNSKNCAESCKSCKYWVEVWPEQSDRVLNLEAVRSRIRNFQENYSAYAKLNARASAVLAAKMEAVYRDAQHFATTRIKEAVEDVLKALTPTKSVES